MRETLDQLLAKNEPFVNCPATEPAVGRCWVCGTPWRIGTSTCGRALPSAVWHQTYGWLRLERQWDSLVYRSEKHPEFVFRAGRMAQHDGQPLTNATAAEEWEKYTEQKSVARVAHA